MASHALHRPGARLAIGLLAVTLFTGTAWAEKPEWAGRGNSKAQSDGPPGQMKKHRAQRDDRQRQWRGEHDQGRKSRDDRDRRERRAPVAAAQPGSHFNDGQRSQVRQWYSTQYRAGHCPPGLAKKNNGCLPPGQAKKWHVGHPLPAGVVVYPVPQPVLVQIGPPPAGYRYVRVANDILLMVIGTRMVVDAITDLGRIL
ncbi:hypothetical protein [Ottowia testudinis]|uniref:Nickel/cobalt transporter regulator n=1 Tax=Ottowia testudinis TaxID=2816950 RepID=A0A975CF72_9BURK|nr:hypothetical protein [Ottowia testudinis]QTD45290.1 hypothetical protein J1M35_20125 [Ottowia testudinis]